ncbi:CPBP family intramembrane glutamic endopeptidase [uncultured Clostridium sp.]|jgi:hypothetical protein|uniref:CPBP family intramembrane glutamic endopeptidase n=1 Tax=uncultured Clostridium sp. TaxID=59620 RepID=UPI0025EA6BBE|nr:CPBP family intramembrane glutamic endopeptidase [uncultured Clostridium sp.]
MVSIRLNNKTTYGSSIDFLINSCILLITNYVLEEIIFRGFIQQRLKGLIKNRYINLIVVAIIFGSIYIPFILAQNNITFIESFVSTIPKMIIHIYFVAVYKAGNNSVISTSVLHGINNFILTLY